MLHPASVTRSVLPASVTRSVLPASVHSTYIPASVHSTYIPASVTRTVTPASVTRTVTPASVTVRSATVRSSACFPLPAHRAACYSGAGRHAGCTWEEEGCYIPRVVGTLHIPEGVHIHHFNTRLYTFWQETGRSMGPVTGLGGGNNGE